MICTRINDPEWERLNYVFINEGKDVRVWNNDKEIIMSYQDWLSNYYIVDKWKTV